MIIEIMCDYSPISMSSSSMSSNTSEMRSPAMSLYITSSLSQGLTHGHFSTFYVTTNVVRANKMNCFPISFTMYQVVNYTDCANP